MRNQFILLAAIALFSQVRCTAQTLALKVLNSHPIGGAGGWDYLAVGPVNDWLYVSHSSQVNIINKNTGDSVGVIENTTGVHGIAFDVADGLGFTSNGRLNNVSVFDLHTNKVLQQVSTGQNPDAIIFEPFSKKIITCNGRSNNLSIIDPKKLMVTDSIDVGGRPEESASDNNGKLFVNIEDKNEIAVIDTKTFKLLHRWSLAPGEGPTGLAYDAKTNRLFAGCDDLLMVMDASNGKIVAKVPIGSGCDGVAFDPASQKIFTSNGGSGTITVVQEHNADTFVVIENAKTRNGARTITIDPATHLLYLPTAEFEPLAPGEKGRPRMKAGSFQVLRVGYK